MNFAICTLDGVVYNVQNFTTLPIIDQHTNREHLICPECKGRAFFRQRSRNGRTACFGARPHLLGCLLAVYDGQGAIHADNDSDIFRNPEPRLVIDLNYGAHLSTAQITSGNLVNGDSYEAAPGKANITQPKRVTQRRLSSVLRALIKCRNIPSSLKEVVIDYLGGFKASDFFVNFDAIKPTHEAHWHGFWGLVVSAVYDARTGTLWMNTGCCWNEPSICISHVFVGDLCLRFDLGDAEDLVGANVLIVGMLKTAKNSKKCIKLAHLNLITIG